MRYSIAIILFIFTCKDSFSQKEVIITNTKTGRIIVIDAFSDVFFQLKNDPALDSKDPNDLSSIKIGKKFYHHGQLSRMTENGLVISREITKGKNKVDTIPLDQFISIGKYRTGKGQRIIGGVLALSGIAFVVAAVNEHNKVKSPLDKAEGTSAETLDKELATISILGSAFCFIYPSHKEFVLGDKWKLSIRKQMEPI